MGNKIESIKFNNTIRDLSNHNYKIGETMRANGYSESTSKAGHHIKRVREGAKRLGFYNPERIERDAERNYKAAQKENNLVILRQYDYDRSKIAGMITDKSEINNKNPEKIVIAYGSNVNKPVDNPDNLPTNNVNNSDIEHTDNKEVI